MSDSESARVIDTIEWAPGLVTLRLDRALQSFAPGQFLNIGSAEHAPGSRRAYSIASAPGAPLEFFISEVPDGALSPSLCRLQPGARIELDPHPQGFFTLKWLPEAAELWLCATGTGLAPFISLLRSQQLFSRFERVVLVHGVRANAHLAYAAELRSLAHEREAFRYVPIVSREAPGSDMLAGRITSALASGTLEQHAGTVISAERSHLMLCGNPAMIDELQSLLAARGLRRHRTRAPGHITSERYWEQ